MKSFIEWKHDNVFPNTELPKWASDRVYASVDPKYDPYRRVESSKYFCLPDNTVQATFIGKHTHYNAEYDGIPKCVIADDWTKRALVQSSKDLSFDTVYFQMETSEIKWEELVYILGGVGYVWFKNQLLHCSEKGISFWENGKEVNYIKFL